MNWNSTVPDALRGRLAGIELIRYSGGPLLGNVESGAAAAAFGPQVAIFAGGALCLLGVTACALALPRFRRFGNRAPSAVGAAAEAAPTSAGQER